MKTINKIAGYRIMIGFKQQDMADVLDISVQSYGNKERGYRPFTDDEKVIIKDLIAKEIQPNIKIDDIFF